MSSIAEALGYEMTERTRLKVHVQVHGEGHRLEVLGPCMDFEEAQRAYTAFRDESGLGMRHLGEGAVHDEYGQQLARISYNGKLWEPMPWTPGLSPIAEAPTLEVEAEPDADEDGLSF